MEQKAPKSQSSDCTPKPDGTPGWAIDDRWHFDKPGWWKEHKEWWRKKPTKLGRFFERTYSIYWRISRSIQFKDISQGFSGIFDLLAKMAIGILFVSLCHILVRNLGLTGKAEIAAFVVITLIISIKLKQVVKWL